MNSNSQPSVETAIAGQYDFSIKVLLTEAWQKVMGFKAPFWKALACILAITFVTSFIAFHIDSSVEGITSAEAAASPRPLIQLIQMVFSIFLITPLFAGLMMMTIKHSIGEEVPFTSIFQYVKYWKKLWVYPVAMTVLALIKDVFIDYDSIQLFLFLVMLFITVTYIMFIPLVVDKNLETWPALEVSRKAAFHHWFKILGLVITLFLIIIASSLTLGIAFIWTAPWMYNAIAILYRDMFGVQR